MYLCICNFHLYIYQCIFLVPKKLNFSIVIGPDPLFKLTSYNRQIKLQDFSFDKKTIGHTWPHSK